MPSNRSTTLDLDQLVARLGGDEGEAWDILEVFVEDASEWLTELAMAIDADDLERAAAIAHTLRGSAANVGAIEVSACSMALSRQVRRGNVAAARQALTRIRHGLDKCQSELVRRPR
jgi:HPt (histidine-containing phosphotransfer) domain-containing protein